MQRRNHSVEMKVKIAIESLKGQKTINEIASGYGVHPNQVSRWKQEALEILAAGFSRRRERAAKEESELRERLYSQIGQLKVELDWLKKNLDWPYEVRRGLIEAGHPEIGVARQCELVGISRSGYYYAPVAESELNLELMRVLDEQYTATPFYGVRRMTAWLRRQGYSVNHKRVARLMRAMGLEAIYPKPNLSRPSLMQARYPYLLKGLSIDRANHVWSADITYIRLAKGFVYLVASWTGIAATCWRGRSPSRWRWDFALKPSGRRSTLGVRRFSIRIKGHSLPAETGAWPWKPNRSASAWMGAGGRWIMCLSSGFGAR